MRAKSPVRSKPQQVADLGHNLGNKHESRHTVVLGMFSRFILGREHSPSYPSYPPSERLTLRHRSCSSSPPFHRIAHAPSAGVPRLMTHHQLRPPPSVCFLLSF